RVPLAQELRAWWEKGGGPRRAQASAPAHAPARPPAEAVLPVQRRCAKCEAEFDGQPEAEGGEASEPMLQRAPEASPWPPPGRQDSQLAWPDSHPPQSQKDGARQQLPGVIRATLARFPVVPSIAPVQPPMLQRARPDGQATALGSRGILYLFDEKGESIAE